MIGLLLTSLNLKGESYKIVTGDNYPPCADKKYPREGIATIIVSEVFKEMGDALQIN